MFVSLIIFLSIVFPLLMKNKKKGLIISMCLLFILWGLEYNLVVDWDANLERWNLANNPSAVKHYGVNTDYLYQIILKLFKPLSFYGWLMFSAVLELYVIYKFTLKFVLPKYYWITIFILMMRVYLGFMMINSNRQSIALIATMMSLYFVLYTYSIKSVKNRIKIIGISVLLFISSIFIHKSACFVIIFIPILLLLPILGKIKTKYIVIIFNVVFFLRYFMSPEIFMNSILNYWGILGNDSYTGYIKEMEDVGFENSFFEQFFNWLIVMASSIYFRNLTRPCQLFAICYLFSLFFQTLLGANIQRVMMYLSIYVIFLVPNLVGIISKSITKRNKLVVNLLYGLMIAFCIASYYKNIYQSSSTSNHYKWRNFKTVFEADHWQ